MLISLVKSQQSCYGNWQNFDVGEYEMMLIVNPYKHLIYIIEMHVNKDCLDF